MHPERSRHARPLLWGLVALGFILSYLYLSPAQLLRAQGGTIPEPSFSKSDQGASVTPGGTVTYRLSYNNPAGQTLIGARITETVPIHTTFLPASNPGWTCAGSTCVTLLGDIGPGAGGFVDFVVQMANPAPAGVESVSNTASFGSSIYGLLATRSDSTPVTAAPDLFVSKTDNRTSTTPGNLLSYNITYGNKGNQSASGVVLTEVVPTGTRYVAAQSSAGWSCVPASGVAGSTCTYAVGALAAGAPNASVTFAVTVLDPAAPGLFQIRNTVTIADNQASGPDSDPSNNSASDTTTLNAAPDMTVTKSASASAVAPGDQIIYTIVFANQGNQAARGIQVLEALPANTQFVAAASSPGWSFDSALGKYKYTLSSLWGGSSRTIAFGVKVNPSIPPGVSKLINVVTVNDDGTNGPDANSANNSFSLETPLTGAPDLSVVKSDGDVTAEPGDTVVYTINYTNLSGRGATGVFLQETVPAHTTFSPAASSPGWVCTPNNNAGSACALSLGALAGGVNGAALFAVRLDAVLPPQVLQVNNTVVIVDDGASGVDMNPNNNSDSEATPVAGASALNVTKSDDGFVAPPGSTIEYTLNYANFDTQPAPNVRITETVPAHTTFAGPAGAWNCAVGAPAGATCVHTVGNLAVGATGAVRFDTRLIDPLPDDAVVITNVAAIGSSIHPNAGTGSETTPIGGAPDLTLTKNDDGVTATPGSVVTYRLNYANTGNRVATVVRITETVPAYTTFNAALSTTGWNCQAGGAPNSICIFAIDRLPPGASGAVDFAVTVQSLLPSGVSAIHNTASINDDGLHNSDPNPANNTATRATPVNAAPDLSLEKDDGGVVARPGRHIVYQLSYANLGNQAATGVLITETTPAHTGFNAMLSSEGWNCTPDDNAGSVCTFLIGDVGAGQTGVIAFAVTVSRPLPTGLALIANTATIGDDGANGVDSNPANNTDSVETPVQSAPIDIQKDDGGVIADEGDVIEYLLTYTSNLDALASSVQITETVPAHSVFIGPAESWSCPIGSLAGTLCFHTVGDLAPDQSGSVAFSVRVNTDLPTGVTAIVNQALIGNPVLPNIDQSTTSTPLKTPPALTLVKSDEGAVAVAGQTLGYVLTYGNAGDRPASNVVLTEVVPPHTTFAGPASLWSCEVGDAAGTICTQPLGVLDGKSSASTIFAVAVAERAPAGVTAIANTATIDSAETDPIERSITTPLAAAPDLRLRKSDGGASARPGDLIAYELRYDNLGSQGATNVILTEQVPANTTFNSGASTPGWSCGGGVCTLLVGNLAAGAGGSASFAVTVNSNLPQGVSTVSNTASIGDDGANGVDLNPADNSATDTTPIVTALRLVASKVYALTDDVNEDGVVNPGDTIEYTIEIANRSGAPISGILLRDVFDPNTRIAAANAIAASVGTVVSGNSVNDTVVEVFLGTLADGQSATVRFPVAIISPLPIGVTFVENQGVIESVGNPSVVTDDPAAPGVNNRTRTPVVGAALLQVTKADLIAFDLNNNGLIEPGDRLLYRIRVVNNGDIGLSDVVLDDTPDANTTLKRDSIRTNRGAITAGTQPGAQQVRIEIPQLLPGVNNRAEISFEVTVNGDTFVETVYNQATVSYLFNGLPVVLLSDDPKTPTVPNDATATAVTQTEIPVNPNTQVFLPLVSN